MTAASLFGFGAAGLVGNIVTGVFIDRHLKSVLILALGLMSVCLLALGMAGTSAGTPLLVSLLVGWGMSIAAVFVGFQTWILRLAGDAALPASSIYVAIFNAAIGTGALIGSAVLARSGLGGLMLLAGAATASSIVPVSLLGALGPTLNESEVHTTTNEGSDYAR